MYTNVVLGPNVKRLCYFDANSEKYIVLFGTALVGLQRISKSSPINQKPQLLWPHLSQQVWKEC